MDTDYCRSRRLYYCLFRAILASQDSVHRSDDIDIGDIEATNKDAIDRSRGIVMYIRFTKLVL